MPTPPAILDLAARHGLDPGWPDEVRAEAAAWVARPAVTDPALVDRTDLPFVTIDEEHSRDLDQALFVEAAGSGWRVWYAIADAAWYVRPGTALFAEALRRGTSFYLPGLVVPMLPPELSEGVVSLNAGVDRRALLFRVDLLPTGEVHAVGVERARVRSRLKTWYDAVQAWFDGRALLPAGPEVAASLRALREVGEARMRLAEGRDVVRYRRTELEVHLASGDASFVARGDLRNDVERWNEQISLLCNVEGGRLLVDAPPHVQPVFRNHDPPAEEALDGLAALVEALVRVHRLDPQAWTWHRHHEPLGRWLDRLPHGGPEGRIAQALHRQALLATSGASFGATPSGHHGVGAAVYARFTAPMREIVGVFTHKEFWERHGVTPHPDAADLDLRDRVIAASHTARHLQRTLDREANRLVLDAMFAVEHGRPLAERPVRRGTVMGLARGKVHVLLDEPPIDVKVYTLHLEAALGTRLVLGRDGTALRDERSGDAVVRVGDEVSVVVVGRDERLDRWELALVAGADRDRDLTGARRKVGR